jgi:hypothetical protein
VTLNSRKEQISVMGGVEQSRYPITVRRKKARLGVEVVMAAVDLRRLGLGLAATKH